MFIDQNGNLYQGEMRLGDREATPEEIATWDAVRNAPPPLQQIESLEQFQIKRTARAIREERLKQMESYAQTTLGLNPTQLYAAASLPNAATALRSYKELKDLDNEIAELRKKL